MQMNQRISFSLKTLSFTLESLCLLADYPIASDSLLQDALEQVRAEKHRLSPGCSACASPCGRTEDLDVVSLHSFSSEQKALCQALVLYAAQKTSCDSCVYDALFALGMPDGSGRVYSIDHENA